MSAWILALAEWILLVLAVVAAEIGLNRRLSK